MKNTTSAFHSAFLGLATILSLSVSASVAQAALRGFEPSQGYSDISIWNAPPPPAFNGFDVTQYNAGQPGGYTPGPSAWSKTQGNVIAVGTAPIAGTAGYATGHNASGGVMPRTGTQALVVTANVQGAGGPLNGAQQYRYLLDSTDLGVAPATTANSIVNLSWWSCAELWGVSAGGLLTDGNTGNYVSFRDNNQVVGLELGYIYRAASDNFAYKIGNNWVDTGVAVVNPHAWHQFNVSINLLTDTATISLVPAEGNPSQVLFSGALTNPMGSLNSLLFTSQPGPAVTGIPAKRWALDDFSGSATVVPEPSSLAVCALGLIGYGLWHLRARARLSALTLLAMCSFVALTADTAEAQFITVTSVTDGVRLKETELNLTAAGSVLTGNTLERIVGTGDHMTDGYRSRQRTIFNGSSLDFVSNVDIPNGGSILPNPFPNGVGGAFGASGSTVLFTATSNSQYTAAGDNLFGNGNIGTYLTFILKDVTNNINLVEFTDGWNNGLPVSSTTGSLTGNLIAGNQYSWTQEFVAGKRAEFSGLGFQADGIASLNLTAVAVPEPSTVVLLGLAALGMFSWRRFR